MAALKRQLKQAAHEQAQVVRDLEDLVRTYANQIQTLALHAKDSKPRTAD